MVGLSGLEQDGGKSRRGPRRDKSVVELAGELDTLFCSSEREVEVARCECDDGSVEEVSGKCRWRPEQSSTLDRPIEQLRSICELAADVPDPGQDGVQAVQRI